MPRVTFRNALDADNGAAPVTYSGFTPNKYAAVADVGTGDGTSEANAMDLPTALAGLVAGDILGVLPGVYTAASTQSSVPCFAPSASGTAGNPIRIVCKYAAAYLATPGTDANRSEFALSDGTNTGTDDHDSPVLGTGQGRNYVEIWGPYADQADAPPQPSGGTFQIWDSNNSGFYEAHVDISSMAFTPSDNHNAIFVQASDTVTIKNCRFSGGSGAGNHNKAAVTLYGVTNCTFEHNEGTNVNTFLFVKGSADAGATLNSGSARYNSIDGCGESAFVVNVTTSGAGFSVYQNLIVDPFNGIEWDDSSTEVPYCDCYNNTVINPSRAGLYHATKAQGGSAWYNNIVYWPTSITSEGWGVYSEADISASTISPFDYNYYYENGGSELWANSGSNVTSLASWRTASGGETNSSDSTDPQFVGGGDYSLGGGSPALTAGNTGGPIGCYITGSETIGIEAQ